MDLFCHGSANNSNARNFKSGKRYQKFKQRQFERYKLLQNKEIPQGIAANSVSNKIEPQFFARPRIHNTIHCSPAFVNNSNNKAADLLNIELNQETLSDDESPPPPSNTNRETFLEEVETGVNFENIPDSSVCQIPFEIIEAEDILLWDCPPYKKRKLDTDLLDSQYNVSSTPTPTASVFSLHQFQGDQQNTDEEGSQIVYPENINQFGNLACNSNYYDYGQDQCSGFGFDACYNSCSQPMCHWQYIPIEENDHPPSGAVQNFQEWNPALGLSVYENAAEAESESRKEIHHQASLNQFYSSCNNNDADFVPAVPFCVSTSNYENQDYFYIENEEKEGDGFSSSKSTAKPKINLSWSNVNPFHVIFDAERNDKTQSQKDLTSDLGDDDGDSDLDPDAGPMLDEDAYLDLFDDDVNIEEGNRPVNFSLFDEIFMSAGSHPVFNTKRSQSIDSCKIFDLPEGDDKALVTIHPKHSFSPSCAYNRVSSSVFEIPELNVQEYTNDPEEDDYDTNPEVTDVEERRCKSLSAKYLNSSRIFSILRINRVDSLHSSCSTSPTSASSSLVSYLNSRSSTSKIQSNLSNPQLRFQNIFQFQPSNQDFNLGLGLVCTNEGSENSKTNLKLNLPILPLAIFEGANVNANPHICIRSDESEFAILEKDSDANNDTGNILRIGMLHSNSLPAVAIYTLLNSCKSKSQHSSNCLHRRAISVAITQQYNESELNQGQKSVVTSDETIFLARSRSTPELDSDSDKSYELVELFDKKSRSTPSSKRTSSLLSFSPCESFVSEIDENPIPAKLDLLEPPVQEELQNIESVRQSQNELLCSILSFEKTESVSISSLSKFYPPPTPMSTSKSKKEVRKSQDSLQNSSTDCEIASKASTSNYTHQQGQSQSELLPLSVEKTESILPLKKFDSPPAPMLSSKSKKEVRKSQDSCQNSNTECELALNAKASTSNYPQQGQGQSQSELLSFVLSLEKTESVLPLNERYSPPTPMLTSKSKIEEHEVRKSQDSVQNSNSNFNLPLKASISNNNNENERTENTEVLISQSVRKSSNDVNDEFASKITATILKGESEDVLKSSIITSKLLLPEIQEKLRIETTSSTMRQSSKVSFKKVSELMDSDSRSPSKTTDKSSSSVQNGNYDKAADTPEANIRSTILKQNSSSSSKENQNEVVVDPDLIVSADVESESNTALLNTNTSIPGKSKISTVLLDQTEPLSFSNDSNLILTLTPNNATSTSSATKNVHQKVLDHDCAITEPKERQKSTSLTNQLVIQDKERSNCDVNNTESNNNDADLKLKSLLNIFEEKPQSQTQTTLQENPSNTHLTHVTSKIPIQEIKICRRRQRDRRSSCSVVPLSTSVTSKDGSHSSSANSDFETAHYSKHRRRKKQPGRNQKQNTADQNQNQNKKERSSEYSRSKSKSNNYKKDSSKKTQEKETMYEKSSITSQTKSKFQLEYKHLKYYDRYFEEGSNCKTKYNSQFYNNESTVEESTSEGGFCVAQPKQSRYTRASSKLRRIPGKPNNAIMSKYNNNFSETAESQLTTSYYSDTSTTTNNINSSSAGLDTGKARHRKSGRKKLTWWQKIRRYFFSCESRRTKRSDSSEDFSSVESEKDSQPSMSFFEQMLFWWRRKTHRKVAVYVHHKDSLQLIRIKRQKWLREMHEFSEDCKTVNVNVRSATAERNRDRSRKRSFKTNVQPEKDTVKNAKSKQSRRRHHHHNIAIKNGPNTKNYTPKRNNNYEIAPQVINSEGCVVLKEDKVYLDILNGNKPKEKDEAKKLNAPIKGILKNTRVRFQDESKKGEMSSRKKSCKSNPRSKRTEYKYY